MDIHISRLTVFQMAETNHKKLLVHMDLVHQLKFVCLAPLVLLKILKREIKIDA